MKTSGRIWAARILALTADAVQLGFFPLFVGGAPEGFDAVLDVIVGVSMVALCGWHWAFLPAFLVELLPGADLAPTWTLAVLIATRGSAGGTSEAGAIPAYRVDDAQPAPRPPAPPLPPANS